MLGTGLGVYIPLALYIVAGLACILSLFWRPVIGFYLLILVMPQHRLRMRIDDWPLGAHIIVILLACVLLGLVFKGQLPIRSKINRVVIVLFVYTLLTVLAGVVFVPESPFVARLVQWKDYMVMPALFFATTAVVRTRRDLIAALLVLCFSSFLIDRSFGLEIHSRDFSQFSEDSRDVGPLGLGSNHTAAFVAQTAVFLFAMLGLKTKVHGKIILWALFALNVYCVLFAFSRAAYLGFGASLLFMLLLKHRKWIPVLIVLAIAWEVVIPTAVVQRVEMTHESGKLDSSAEMRVVLWQDSLNLFLANPLGWGYATYQYMDRVGDLRDTHNYYMKALVETGILGLGILLALLWKFFRVSWQLFRRTSDPLFNALGLGAAATTICMFIVNLFGDRWSFVEINGIVWIMFGLVACAHVLVDQSESSAPVVKAEEVESPSYLQPVYP